MSRQRPVYLSLVLLLVLVILAGPLTACPAPPAPATPTTAPAAPAKATTAPVATTPAAVTTPAPALATPVKPAATPAGAMAPVTGTYTGPLAREQVLRANLIQEPPTLDPNKAEDTTSLAVLAPMYEGLTRFRPDLTIEPAIAQSWNISADGKTFIFKLRDAKWSDGTPLTAKDFEYSWKRLLNPNTASPYAFVLTEEVAGAEEFNSAQVPTDTAKLPQLEAAVGVKAVDDKTFQVTLKGPATYFLSVAALWVVFPVNRAAVEKGGDKWTEPPNHVSNGPFILKTWQHQSSITLEPNPNYWDTKPTLARIQYSMIGDQKAALEAYKNNELDIAEPPLADIPALRADPTLSKEIMQISRTTTYYVGFNTAAEPFTGEKGKLVRQAFSQAIDRKTLVDVVTKGVNLPGASFLPPGLFGHQPTVGFQFDPAKAKETLQKAGYADGKALGRITVMYNSPPVPGHKPIIEFIADQLTKNLGVDVEIKTMEWAAYLGLLKTKDAPQMFRMGWNSDYPHPNDWLNVVFNSKSVQNYSKYNNAQFDKLVTDAAREPDQAKQLQMYNQAQQILVDDAPVIFIYWYGRFRMVKPWVKDLVTTPQDPDLGEYFMRLMKIAQH